MSTTSPRILLVGPLSLDVFVDGDRSRRAPGGAVAYAARAASALGERLAILTAAAAGDDLEAFDGHDLHLVETARTLSFELRTTNEGRRLRLLQRNGHTLSAADLPRGWTEPQLIILAPLLPGDIDLASFDGLAATASTTPRRMVMAQGLQRLTDHSSAIFRAPHPAGTLLRLCTPRTSIVLSEGETSPWSAADIETVTARAAHLIVTRGRAGADIYTASRPPLHVDAAPAQPLDTTGAGDVFAAAFALTLHQVAAEAVEESAEERVQRAATVASACAATSVEVQGPRPLPVRAEIMRRAATVARVGRP